MNKEALKLEPYLKYTYKDKGYKIKCYGSGRHTPWYCITREMSEIDDLELVLMSCLNSSYYKDLEKSPIKKYWAYLYDDDCFGIIDRDWDRFNIQIYVYNEDGSYTVMTPPRFEKLFNSNEEFEQYLKEEFDSMRRYSDEEGELLQPWELDEAREVLAQDGWDRKNYTYSWHQELIDEKEYHLRVMRSTCRCDSNSQADFRIRLSKLGIV